MASIFTSSIGKKLWVALAGLFLAVFLLVHLGINLLVLLPGSAPESSEYIAPGLYNMAAHFMGNNILIKIFEIVLIGGLLLHVIYTLVLQVQNWIARPRRYSKANYSNTSFFSKFMIHTALITLAFLAIHLADFYFRAKFGHGGSEIEVDGVSYHDFTSEVIDKFKMLPYVIFYIASFLFLGFHVVHGFQSAWKTLGIESKGFNAFVQVVTIIYSVIIVGGFSIIPLLIYFS